MTLVFWLSLALVVYTYLLYPILVWLAARLAPASARRRTALSKPDLPAVSVCIAARNEAGRVSRKIENLRAQTYPQDLIEIVIASDGSLDDTIEMARKYEGTVTVDCESGGKAAALNRAVAASCGSILLFTDVRQHLNPNGIRALVDCLRDSAIGVASGELVHMDPGTNVEATIGLYWRYEKWLRRAESDYFSMVGATGALYAMRRIDFVPMRPGTILDDFDLPMAVVKKGMRIVFEGHAKAYDAIEPSIAGERRRKIRTLAGNWQSLAANPWLLNPLSNPVFLQYVSHKLFRLLVPFALLGMLAAAWTAVSVGFRILAVLQTCFWTAALVGSIVPKLQKIRLICLASVFLELNWAAVAGLAFLLFGKTSALWKQPS